MDTGTAISNGAGPPLCLADLNTAVNHEPRISHQRLAKALGYTDDRMLARLAERHEAALQRFGEVSVTVTETRKKRREVSVTVTETQKRSGEVSATVAETSKKGGRPGNVLWFNKRQALFLCSKSDMPLATEVTIRMVEVFDQYLVGVRASVHGYAPPVPPVAPPPRLPATAVQHRLNIMTTSDPGTVRIDAVVPASVACDLAGSFASYHQQLAERAQIGR